MGEDDRSGRARRLPLRQHLRVRTNDRARTHPRTGTDVGAAADARSLPHHGPRAHPDGSCQVGTGADVRAGFHPAAGAEACAGLDRRALVYPGVLLDTCARIDIGAGRDHAATVLVPAVPHDRAVVELKLLVLLPRQWCPLSSSDITTTSHAEFPISPPARNGAQHGYRAPSGLS